ncbi:MAG: DUF1295 domain-containing protein [Anaerolineaceae bacterium]|nr:DUF1295 domain-containing protein [Anaerolineaceae bacterium]
MLVLWIMSLFLKNTSIVDIFWGAGFVMSVWVVFVKTFGYVTFRHWLFAILVTIWGLRLTIYLIIRNTGKPEDFRYANWRKQYGNNWWWVSFFQTFMLQGLIMWIVSSPLTVMQLSATPSKMNIFNYFGIVLWVIGFIFEFFGDLQLAMFRNKPSNKGKLLNTGVWRYTRHPNYFGDSTQWWGFYLLALTTGWWTIFSPIIMTYLLVKVSGVALLEKTLIENKPGYKEYAENTNAFFPWFPKNKTNKL